MTNLDILIPTCDRPHLWAAAMGEGLEVEDPDSLQVSFDRLDRQDSFYDQDALVKNQQHVLGIYHRLLPDDIVFFSDAWNPAIPTLRYLLACQGFGPEEGPRFYGPLHSSVHFPADLLGPHASRFADALEAAILDSLDGAFLATSAGIQPLLDNPFVTEHVRSKLHVTRLPFDLHRKVYLHHKRDANLVVWPHRWATDKGKDTLVRLAQVSDRKYRIRVLSPVPLQEDEYLTEAREAGVEFTYCPTRQNYFDNLSAAGMVLSTARLETFGYAVMEGWFHGCIPLVPDLPAYRELWHSDFLYQPVTVDSVDACLELSAAMEHLLHSYRLHAPKRGVGANKRVPALKVSALDISSAATAMVRVMTGPALEGGAR